uniref:Uncharacterized protein n=1 Tax=Picea glauca TaxID=3330 RepID=A0A117NG79_PICGL|nr:hypothetical protein ABT39_MTgene1804 [Picea glauca]
MHSPAFALKIDRHSGPVPSPSTASGVDVSPHHPIPIYSFLPSTTIIIGFGNPTTSIRIPRIHPGMDHLTLGLSLLIHPRTWNYAQPITLD